MKKLKIGHKIYRITNYVNIWPLSVTLALKVGTQMLPMTYHLIIVAICAKYLQNPLIYEEVMDGIQNIPNNRLC
jgi:hypothetical protein